MSWTQTAIGVAVLGGGLQMVIGSALPDEKFMTVKRMEYDGAQVHFERVIRRDSVADWSVTVVQGGDDICHGGGSAAYTQSEAQFQPMPLDVFVGDMCLLVPGATYEMFAHWVPRDGSATVSAQTSFVAD